MISSAVQLWQCSHEQSIALWRITSVGNATWLPGFPWLSVPMLDVDPRMFLLLCLLWSFESLMGYPFSKLNFPKTFLVRLLVYHHVGNWILSYSKFLLSAANILTSPSWLDRWWKIFVFIWRSSFQSTHFWMLKGFRRKLRCILPLQRFMKDFASSGADPESPGDSALGFTTPLRTHSECKTRPGIVEVCYYYIMTWLRSHAIYFIWLHNLKRPWFGSCTWLHHFRIWLFAANSQNV